MKHNELAGIDIAKFWFCLCVVALHCHVLEGFSDRICFYATRFILYPAVPFFFIASGFFLGRKIDKDGYSIAIESYCKRLLPILMFFETIAIIINVTTYCQSGLESCEIIINVVKSVLFYPWGAMWYIWACIVGAIIIWLLNKMRVSFNVMIVLGMVLYVFGLLLYSYSFLLECAGLDFLVDGYMKIFVSHRNGVFFGFPLIMLGYFVQNKRFVETMKIKQVNYFLAISVILMVIEVALLRQSDDFLISQIFFAPILFIRIAKQGKVVESKTTRLLRKLSVGIYVLHRPLMTVWSVILKRISFYEYNIALFVVTLVSAVVICMVIYHKIPRLMKLVS